MSPAELAAFSMDPTTSSPHATYPFAIPVEGGTNGLGRHVASHKRTFDFNTDGLAHVGLLPDLIEDWRVQGMRPQDLEPLYDSAEAYVRLWERTHTVMANDGDDVPSASDNCPLAPNPDQKDTDADGQGDACDLDDDADGVLDARDNCALLSNPGQANLDGDAFGDACDADVDNDGVANASDCAPRNAAIKPGAQERPYTNVDENCDGLADDKVEGAVQKVKGVVSGLAVTAWKSTTARTAMVTELDAVTRQVNTARAQTNATTRATQLRAVRTKVSGLIAKTNGCSSLAKKPDADDVVVTCFSQARLHPALTQLSAWVALLK